MILMRAIDTLMNLILMFNFLLNHHLDASRNFDFNKNKTEPTFSQISSSCLSHIVNIITTHTNTDSWESS